MKKLCEIEVEIDQKNRLTFHRFYIWLEKINEDKIIEIIKTNIIKKVKKIKNKVVN